MAYVNLYNSISNGYIRRLVRLGNYNFALGWVASSQPYLAKYDTNGNLIWQKKYNISGVDNGNWIWDKAHFTDIIELINTGELLVLASDQSNFFILKLASNGNLISSKKIYDKSDTPLAYNGLSVNARLFKLHEDAIVLKITDIHSQNGSVKRIDHLFYRIDTIEVAVIGANKIVSQNPVLLIRDEQVSENNLVLYGNKRDQGIIISIDADLNLVQSSALYYNGELRGFNNLHIYTVSPVHNGKYAVMGSYYHYDPDGGEDDLLSFTLNTRENELIIRDVIAVLAEYTEPLPDRFNRFFIAEISQDHSTILNEKLLEKEFSPTYQSVYTNTQGIFFSVGSQLYKCNNNLTNTDWTKKIIVPELSSNFSLLLNKSIGNSFDAYANKAIGGKFAVASTSLNYESCKTEVVDDEVRLINQNFAITDLAIDMEGHDPSEYDNPSVNVTTINNDSEELCEDEGPILDLENSTITANPAVINADGSSTSLIIVTLKDNQGNTINPSSYTVQINTNAGTWVNAVNSSGNGMYTRTLRSTVLQQIAIVNFSVSGIGTSPNTTNVQFIAEGEGEPITIEEGLTSIQSDYLYLQATGSEGADSTEGRHLRWALRGTLGEKHLPKGNYASNNVNFNKSEDFVKIYKAAYIKKTVKLDLKNQNPAVIDDTNHLWIYRLYEQEEFYIYFRNTVKYNQVRASINPLSNAPQFINNYGSELIEVESIKKPFFAATCNFSSVTSGAQLKVETLSVSTLDINAFKVVSNRKAINNPQLNNSLELIMENGRSIRWQINNAKLDSIDFEFYENTIQEVNNTTGWTLMGDFALTENDSVAFSQLEASPGDVDKLWEQFNTEALVKVSNYHKKWNATPEPGDRNIKQVVNKYIQLSDNINNPLAEESISLGNDPSDPDDYMHLSNLGMLNFLANDYHMARMLGLGILDTDITSPINKWLYIAEYYTTADLEDGLGERDVQHLYMSLPTTNQDFRLPAAIDLKDIVPGIFFQGDNNSSLTDEDGYIPNGMARYVSLYTEDLLEDDINTPFFITNNEINLSIITTPVYGGLKYRLDNGDWVKPELSNNPDYLHAAPPGENEFFETRFILIPEPLKAYYTHKQSASGTHKYKSYGINWFSRVKVSSIELQINTLIKQQNPLLAPSNTNALLVREENPLFLTSNIEQERLSLISDGNDKTLIRLTYDYHSFHELKNYNVSVDSPYNNQDLINLVNDPQVLFPDNEEIFAEEIDIFFRNQMPKNITGKALTVIDHSSQEVLSVITTGSYTLVSTGESITPILTPGEENNYVGGVFVSGNNKYIIHSVTQGVQGPTLTVYKKEISDSIVNGGIPTIPTDNILEAPILVTDGLFMAIENMQTPSTWGNLNPLTYKVQVGDNWSIHREVIEEIDDAGETIKKVEKSRGIWDNATVTPIDEPIAVNPSDPDNPIMGFKGLYRIEFDNFILNQHPQFNNTGVSTEWYKGIVRIFTEDAVAPTVPKNSRKVLPVMKIENIDTGNKLVVFIKDPTYDDDTNYDKIQTGASISVNFYPGYKVYFYENETYGLTEENILPAEGEGTRYSIFGFRSNDLNEGHVSKISTPAPMFAQEIIEALPPEQPEGALYATRPDFFGRSTYTLTTEYKHKPHGVIFYRANDEALLNALYEKSTVKTIRENLETLGGNDEEYLVNRWENFLDFGTLGNDGDYTIYPPAGVSPDGYKFPNPDKQAFFDWANQILTDLGGGQTISDQPGTLQVGDPKIIGFVKGAIYNAFVSLTETPVLYQYIKGSNYKPQDKPQVIKDRNGHTIPPGSPDFEMAPMMKVTGTSPHKTLFTDFKLDGTSNNLYFYGVKELSSQMKMSGFSPFLGPIKLVNTNAPEAPEIKRIVPVLENAVLGINPKIQIEINAFPKVQQIRKINIYRAFSLLEAQSILSMQLVKVIDLEDGAIIDEPIWTVADKFEDLAEIPYGDGIFYRVTASRKVEYAEADGTVVLEYAPSQPSKIVASLIVEVNTPSAPTLDYTSTPPDANDEIHNVILNWDKTAYKAKYHLYKMNNQGNWFKVYQLQTNDNQISLGLVNTDLQSGILNLTNNEGDPVYHHFKVVTENTAGVLSTEEKIFTIPSN